MSDDEFDDIPDEFSGVEGINWDELLSAPLPPSSAVPHHDFSDHEDPNRSPSTHYSFDDEELNHDFLAELDDLEKNVLEGGTGPSGAVDAQNTRVHGDSELARRDGAAQNLTISGDSALERRDDLPSSETLIHLSRFFSDVASPSLEFSKVDGIGDVDPNKQVSLKRPRSDSLSPRGQSPSKKGKGKAQGNEGVWQVLSEFEDELTCPICSDIFVAAHLANPCGHSFCGDCGWQWKMKGKNNCLICRTEFSRETPMIPNFAMDNTVEKHISALGQSGLAEWKPGGKKYEEWISRKEQWKKDVADRAKVGPKKAQRPPGVQPMIFDLMFDIMSDDDDEDYEETRVVRRRASRRSRR